MEFFIPGVCLFLVAIIISALVVPNLSPIIIAVLAVIFLTGGVYSHYRMFNYEYRLSTWQDGLKIYAPAVMIFVIILFTMYGIVALFTGVNVPVPNMPEFEMPAANTITNSVMNAYNAASNVVENATESISNTYDDLTNKNGNANGNGNGNANGNNNRNTNRNNGSTNNKGNGTNKNKSVRPPSIIETI